jgi:hypothetical protein
VARPAGSKLGLDPLSADHTQPHRHPDLPPPSPRACQWRLPDFFRRPNQYRAASLHPRLRSH